MTQSIVTKLDDTEYKEVLEKISDANDILEADYENVDIQAEDSTLTYTDNLIDTVSRLREMLQQYLNALTLTKTNFDHIRENFKNLDEELADSIK